NPMVPSLRVVARRRLRAPRRSITSSMPAGLGADLVIRSFSCSSMLGMAVLLIVGKRERIGEVRSCFEELALDRALARVHLGGDLRGGQVEVIAEDGHLALAARQRRQRAGDVHPIAARPLEPR